MKKQYVLRGKLIGAAGTASETKDLLILQAGTAKAAKKKLKARKVRRTRDGMLGFVGTSLDVTPSPETIFIIAKARVRTLRIHGKIRRPALKREIHELRVRYDAFTLHPLPFL